MRTLKRWARRVNLVTTMYDKKCNLNKKVERCENIVSSIYIDHNKPKKMMVLNLSPLDNWIDKNDWFIRTITKTGIW